MGVHYEPSVTMQHSATIEYNLKSSLERKIQEIGNKYVNVPIRSLTIFKKSDPAKLTEPEDQIIAVRFNSNPNPSFQGQREEALNVSKLIELDPGAINASKEDLTMIPETDHTNPKIADETESGFVEKSVSIEPQSPVELDNNVPETSNTVWIQKPLVSEERSTYLIDNENTIYLFDKSYDASNLEELHRKSGGSVSEFSQWRNWNITLEMENKQKDKQLEEMSARLQEIEEKLMQILTSSK